jgi:hypothetical protein
VCCGWGGGRGGGWEPWWRVSREAVRWSCSQPWQCQLPLSLTNSAGAPVDMPTGGAGGSGARDGGVAGGGVGGSGARGFDGGDLGFTMGRGKSNNAEIRRLAAAIPGPRVSDRKQVGSRTRETWHVGGTGGGGGGRWLPQSLAGPYHLQRCFGWPGALKLAVNPHPTTIASPHPHPVHPTPPASPLPHSRDLRTGGML